MAPGYYLVGWARGDQAVGKVQPPDERDEPAPPDPPQSGPGWRYATDEEMAEHTDRIFDADAEILDGLAEM